MVAHFEVGEMGEWATDGGEAAFDACETAPVEVAAGAQLLDDLAGISLTVQRRELVDRGIGPRFICNLFVAELRRAVRPMAVTPNQAEIDLAWVEASLIDSSPTVIAVYLPARMQVAYVPVAPCMLRKLVRFAWDRDGRIPSVTAWSADGERLALVGTPLARLFARFAKRSIITLSEAEGLIESSFVFPEDGAGFVTFEGPAGGAFIDLLEMEAYS